MGVLLYNASKNAYIAIDARNHTFLTTNPQKARVFTEKTAGNFRNNQLRNVSGAYTMVEIPDDAVVPSPAQSAQPHDNVFCFPDVTPLQDDPAFAGILSELNAKQAQFDRMLVDLYHYAYIHPQLSASKGYKLYRIIREVGARRSKIKKQIRALLQCEEQDSKYNPRSELYDHLSDLL